MHDYPVELYPELMYKMGRPYTCLLINTATKAVVDQDEYIETMRNLSQIAREADDYVDSYVNQAFRSIFYISSHCRRGRGR